MWIPIGSRFSIEQTTTTLSFRSRITSSSNSSQPARYSSTSTWPTGLSSSALSSAAGSSPGVNAIPPPWPPSVKAGRSTTGNARPSGRSSPMLTIRDSGTCSPVERTVSRKSSRSSARAITSTGAPTSSMPELVEDPLFRKPQREVEGCLAAERRQERVGALAAQDVGDALEVERLQVRAVREAGVGHDRRRVRVDDDRAEALGPQHLERLAPGVVELAGLPDDDRPRADQADRMQVRASHGLSPPRSGAMVGPREGRRARSYPADTGATEDAASGRPARPSDAGSGCEPR